MKAGSVFAKVLALALVAVMLMGMLCVAASADQVSTVAEGDQDGLKLNKTVTLEDDGTYKVVLEAYATGETKIETVKQVKPADVILVLDQSGSMVQEALSGIPADTYTEVSTLPTNKELEEGTTEYYYKYGEKYYPVKAVKEVIGKTTGWLGDDGKTYLDDEISNSWSTWYDTEDNVLTFTTSRPFATESLMTFHRDSTGNAYFRYVCDQNSSIKSGYSDLTDLGSNHSGAKGARYYFVNGKSSDLNQGDAYGISPRTAEFHNGEGTGDTDKDNLRYVAASYIAVTKSEINTVRYIYTIEMNGVDTKIGQSAEGDEATVDSTAVSISPLYTQDTKDGTRLEALQYVAKKFINNIQASALKNNVDHRVAIVGFGSDEYTGSTNEYFWSNTELFVGATQYNYYSGGKESTYNQSPNLAANHYGDALQSVNTQTGYNNLIASVGQLAGKGATYPQYGFEMANGIFAEENEAYQNGERSKVVIFLTDGAPGDTGYDATVASNTLTTIGTTKNTYGVKVYTVAVLNSVGTNEDNFLKDSSSSGSYILATDASKLEDFFDSVDKEISSSTTSVELSEKNHVVDLFTDYFTVPAGFSIADNVSVQVAKHVGYESFSTTLTPAPDGVKAELISENEQVVGVDVTGFNFISAENVVTTDDSGGSVKVTGNKLVITIEGLLAKDAAAQDVYINTNRTTSGIWDDDANGDFGMLRAFPMPSTLLQNKMFVLDYAKSAVLGSYASGTPLFDSAADGIFSKVGSENSSFTGDYGKVTAIDGNVLYTPTTMQWKGYDTFYALTKNTELGDSVTKNLWSKVSVIPASNVYYEDSFVTSEETGVVGIVYSGEWTEEKEDNAGSNMETPNNPIHGGWVENDTGLSDDTGFSDGSAYVSSTNSAKATFTFSGNGFDIYSRTNATTGTILVEVAPDAATAQNGAVKQFMIIDNLSASGDYYQIPTVTYSGMYGTYTVTITVTDAAAVDNNRTTYYLDGIRIYNPMSVENMDDTAQGALGDEAVVLFQSVRNLLLDYAPAGPDAQLDGIVFIDKMDHQDGTSGTTNSVAVYEEFGPKNEVYLQKGQSIVFNAGLGANLQIGLKAPEKGTVASVSLLDKEGNPVQAEIEVTHSTDLFYAIQPDAMGNVVIKNNGDGLLSITKLKTLIPQENIMGFANTAEAVAAVDAFESRPTVAYKSLMAAPEETPAEPTTPAETENSGVEIENPSVPDAGVLEEQIRKFVTDLFDTLRGWFGRR